MVEDCSGWIEPLNLECLLINTLAGSIELFMFIAIIAIAGLGAYFRMINMAIMIMFVLFAVIMAQYMPGLYFIAILITGLIVSFVVARLVKR